LRTSRVWWPAASSAESGERLLGRAVGSGRAVPRIVPRRGSIVHRQAVERLPSGCPWGRARQKKYGVKPSEPLPKEGRDNE
jgi:hypothetical protein